VLSQEEVEAVDKERLWEAYTKWPASIRKSLRQPLSLPRTRRISSVVLGGMGGSGSACDILAGWMRPKLRVPVVVVKDYHLPNFAGRDTLVMAVSLSGDTKETIGLLRDSVRRGCSTVGFASGGAMEDLCGKNGIPFNRVEKLLVPRASIPGMVLLPARVLVRLSLIEEPIGFQKVASSVEGALSRTAPSVAFDRNDSKRLAKSMFGKNVVIYSSPDLCSLRHHFKASMNENAKVPAQEETYPELFHNEVETWVAGRSRFLVVLRKESGEEELERKFKKLKEVLRRTKTPVAEFVVNADDIGSLLGVALTLDLATVYLAVLERRAPAQTPLLGQMRRL
jgi:glucose/mannose-6-phosphate isomerase